MLIIIILLYASTFQNGIDLHQIEKAFCAKLHHRKIFENVPTINCCVRRFLLYETDKPKLELNRNLMNHPPEIAIVKISSLCTWTNN